MPSSTMSKGVGKIKSFFPITQWLPTYNRKYLKSDIISGITVGAILIPAAMGYADLAGLPVQYGLYAAMVATLVYFVFGTSHHLILGPSSGPSAMLAGALLALGITDPSTYAAMAAVTAILVGAIFIGARIVRLGFVVNFISDTVLAGFQVGVGLYVISTQLDKLLGISGASGEFFERVVYVVENIGESNLPTLLFGLAGMGFLILGNRYFKKLPNKLILVIAATVIMSITNLEALGIKVAGFIPNGLPSFTIPSVTTSQVLSVLPLAFGLFLLAYVEGIAAAKNFAKRNGYAIDSNQELVGFGVPQIVTGLFQGFPVDASYSNSTVNEESGGKTQLSSAIAGVLIAVVLLLFATFFSSLPQTIIAAVIIIAAFSLVNLKEIRSIYRFDRMEFVFAITALFGVLIFGLLQGVLIGAIVTFVALLYRAANPYIATLGRLPGTDDFADIKRRPQSETTPGVLVVRVNGPVFFPNVEGIKDNILRMIQNSREQVKLVVLTLSASYYLDMSAVTMLRDLYEELATQGITLRVAEATAQVRDKLRKGRLGDIFGEFGPTVDIDYAIRSWQQNEEKKA